MIHGTPLQRQKSLPQPGAGGVSPADKERILFAPRTGQQLLRRERSPKDHLAVVILTLSLDNPAKDSDTDG
jgi:hypothetical protein